MSKAKKPTDLESEKLAWAQLPNRHNSLMGLAWKYRKAGWDENKAVADAQDYYRQVDSGNDHDNEVAEAFHKAYSATWTKGAQRVDVYKAEKQAWRKQQNDKPSLKAEILKADKARTRTQARTAVKSLFKNAQGYVSVGQSVEDIDWVSTFDDFQGLAGRTGVKYMTTATFGTLENEERKADYETKGWKRLAYERTNANLNQIAVMFMEFDMPIGEDKIADFENLPEAEKNKVRDRILTDTCLVLEKCGLRPTTVTFSGNKSYHCLFRLSAPIDLKTWNDKRYELQSAYQRLGADDQILTAMRTTRFPMGTTKQAVDEGTAGQRLMYFDDGAEIDFETFVSKVVTVADSVCPKKDKGIELPMKWETTKFGKKLVYKPELWFPFLDKARVTKAYRQTNKDKQFLIHSNEQGVFEKLTPTLVGDYLVQLAMSINQNDGARFAEERGDKLQAKNMGVFVGKVRPLKTLQDGIFAVNAAFRNGLLIVKPDGVDFRESTYLGYDIPDTEPTLKREFALTTEKSEFETFLEHACGSEENNPEWQNRKRSFMTLLGYLVCRRKEVNNYICVLTEETESEDEGRTGKSLIVKAVRYWRKRQYKDMKRVYTGANGNTRFMWSGLDIEDPPDYFQCDDVNKFFDYSYFFNLATEDMEVEKKGRDIVILPKAEVGKITITTNYFPSMLGDSYEQRIQIFELSNHYNAKRTPNAEFGHMLFEDWTDEEWRRFDNFIVSCIQEYQQAYQASLEASESGRNNDGLISGLVPCTCTNVQHKKYDRMLDGYKGWCERFICHPDMFGEYQYIDDLPANYIEYVRKHVDEHIRVDPKDNKGTNLARKVKAYCEATGLCYEYVNGGHKREMGVDKYGHVYKQSKSCFRIWASAVKCAAKDPTPDVTADDDGVDMNDPFFKDAPSQPTAETAQDVEPQQTAKPDGSPF